MPDQPATLNIWALVNSRSAKEITQLRQQFTSADPFPHMVVDNFFTADFLRSIERDFPVKDENYNRFCADDDGRIGTNYANGDLAQFPRAFKQLDALIQSKAFLNYVSALTGIRELEYDPNYFGGGIRESSSGTFLPPHVDFNYNASTHSHRRMNLLFYFNQEWDESWGGNLQIHQDPNVFNENNSLVRSYQPINNRCLIFETSETSWHGFDRLNLPEGKSRRAFTIYYYTKHRPNEENIKFHNTEYVEPPLPTHLGPGYTLTKADVDLIKEYLMRRDLRIRMLYDLTSEVDALRVEMDAVRTENDVKLRHVWSEYEYYLNLSRSKSRTNALLITGEQWARRLKRALRRFSRRK